MGIAETFIPQQSHSICKTINRDWRFVYSVASEEDLKLKETDYDDADWSAVGLPHTWSTYETTKELHPFIKFPSERDNAYWWYGWGWYRKRFAVASDYRDKKCFLEFDGVQKYCKIWLNGVFIGEHKGGFASFSVDATEAMRFDEDNVLAVEVSNRRNDLFGGIPPMTAGNWEVSAEQARVRVKTYVKNEFAEPKTCTMLTTIVNREGCAIEQMESTHEIEPGQWFEFDQTGGIMEHPHLWSPEDPYLYKVYSAVLDDGRVTDHYESPLGFRWFEWDYGEKRLYLNGVRMHLHGTNRHQEYPWLGDAVPKWMHELDLQDIKYNLGHNFARFCHYTQDKMMYQWCDQHGIIVCEEVPNIKQIEFGDDVQEQQVREMIRRDRNHPSIMMWSMGNETDHAADSRWAREEDAARIIHYRAVSGRGADEPHNHEQINMENVLRCTIRGWHNADVKHWEPESGQHASHEKWQHDRALIEDGSQRGRIDTNGGMWIYADHGADREYVHSLMSAGKPRAFSNRKRQPGNAC